MLEGIPGRQLQEARPDGAFDGRCTLLGGTFALVVQGCLAVAAVSTLVFKRFHETPRRPWVVWAFDASKQAFAGFLQHTVNLGFGVLFATAGDASECAWYLTNFSISVVCGIALIWAAMRGYTYLVERYNWTLLRTGEYGNPPDWRPWLLQMLVWGIISSAEKVLTAAVVIIPLHPHLDAFASWLERPLLPYPNVELLLVMVLAPVLLNVVFFWVMDNLVMRRRPKAEASPNGRAGADDKQAARSKAGPTLILH